MLQELLQDLGCDVPQRLVTLLPQLSPEKQADILLELMQYLYPKRKALELECAIENESDSRIIERARAIEAMSDEELDGRYQQLIDKHIAERQKEREHSSLVTG